MSLTTRYKRTLCVILFIVLLPACSIPLSNNSNTDSTRPDEPIVEVVVEKPTAISPSSAAVPEVIEEEIIEPSAEATEVEIQPTQTIEPEPEQPINPMTGLPVENPDVLQRRFRFQISRHRRGRRQGYHSHRMCIPRSSGSV